MRESRTPGSARGAGSNSRPYRNSRDRNLIPGADAVHLAEGNTTKCFHPDLVGIQVRALERLGTEHAVVVLSLIHISEPTRPY